MSDKRRAGWVPSAFSLPDWPLRRKLALALAIPVLLAATLGGLRVTDELDEADSFSATARQVTVLRPAVDYLAAASRAVITSRERPELDDEARIAAIAEVVAAGEVLEAAGQDAELSGAQTDRLAAVLDLSSQLRASVGYASVGQSVSQIRQLQRSTDELVESIINAQVRPEPRLALLTQVIDGRVSLAMQQYQVAASGADANPVDLAAELGVEAATLDRLAAGLGSTQEQVLALNQQNAAHFGEVRNGGRALGSAEAFEQYDVLASDLLDGIDRQLSAAAADARGRAAASSAVTIGLLLAAILLALLVSRLLLNPVRRLREGALEVANERLPGAVARIRAGDEPGEITPIDVTTREEMGQLARAVDDLHRQAVVLASGEARVRQQVGDMFTTLSRRNTSLVNQQLGLIERLEKDEEDPSRLESLFRLDHLASRMRRTSDSLMVLADAPVAGSERSSLSLGDVLQAALAGVQDYQRVQIEPTPAETVHGGAASDVVHLMTELVDNALAFSPPTRPVRIRTTRAGESVIVEIGDGGLGIAPDVLRSLNDALSAGGEVTSETARRMGLLVVSRLARRHGVTVALTRNSRGGTTASVLLPPSLLLERVVAAAPTRKPDRPALPRRHQPVAAPAPVARPELAVEPIEATLDAVTRLPQRRPPEPPPECDLDLAPVEAQELLQLCEDEATSGLESVVHVPAPSPLDAHTPFEQTEDDSPIFLALRSNWFTPGGSEDRTWARSEVDAGWEAADQVAEARAPELSGSGLPMRRPGRQLVPGGGTPMPTAVARDPEAIRARLAAHAAGVSRGRTSLVEDTTGTAEAGPA